MKHKILITGSNGLLGQKLVKLLLKSEIGFLATSFGANRNPDCPTACYAELDVTNEEAVQRIVRDFMPTAIIHTAAMTNVDQCETDKGGCDRLNVDAVAYLWTAAKEINCHFQLLSTDFVFDGVKGDYSETDIPAPLSYYGNSKYRAEQLLIRDTSVNWSIVRTIIVYGTGHNLSRSNLMLWALDALPAGATMNIVNDQFRAPTWADDLASGCWMVVKKGAQGIFHIAGSKTKSIYDWVCTIATHFNYAVDHVKPISSDTLNQAAKRPPRTGFNLTKSIEILGYTPTPFAETLDLLQKQLNKH